MSKAKEILSNPAMVDGQPSSYLQENLGNGPGGRGFLTRIAEGVKGFFPDEESRKDLVETAVLVGICAAIFRSAVFLGDKIGSERVDYVPPAQQQEQVVQSQGMRVSVEEMKQMVASGNLEICPVQSHLVNMSYMSAGLNAMVNNYLEKAAENMENGGAVYVRCQSMSGAHTYLGGSR